MSIAIVAFIIRELGIKASTLLSDGDDGIDARVRVQKVAYFLKRLGYNIGNGWANLAIHGGVAPLCGSQVLGLLALVLCFVWCLVGDTPW